MAAHSGNGSTDTKPRSLLASVAIPVFDCLALAVAVAAADAADRPGAAFAAAAAALLATSGTAVRRRVSLSLGADLARLVAPVAVAALAVSPFAPDAERLMRMAVAAAILVPIGRGMSYGIVRSARARGKQLEATVIVGTGQLGVTIAATLNRHPEYGFAPLGFVDSAPPPELPLPLLGGERDLSGIIERHRARRVVVAFGAARDEALVSVLRSCDGLPVEIYAVPRFFELGIGTEGAEEIWGIPIARLPRNTLRTVGWRLKRLLDVAAGGIGLLVASPLFILAAIGVRLSGPGPILFRQKRVGRHGEPIEIFKFRTLRVNDDSDTTWSVANDERLTRIGHILRQTHLDELPQLISVIRGDMSLVGPRPERPYFVDLFSAEIRGYADRHRVPVGLTGWAQVHGLNGDTSIEERSRFDNRYIERWSLWRDLTVLTRTAWAVLTGLTSDARNRGRTAAGAGDGVTPAPGRIPLHDRVIDLRPEEIDLREEEVRARPNGNGTRATKKPNRQVKL